MALVSTDPKVVNDPDAPSDGTVVMVKLISPYGMMSTEDIDTHSEEIRFRDADGDEYTAYSWRVRGVDYDAEKGFSTRPQQDGFEMLYYLQGKTPDAINGANLLISTGVEGENIIVELDKAPHKATDEDAAAERTGEGAPTAASFVLGGIRYTISALEDTPAFQLPNRMNQVRFAFRRTLALLMLMQLLLPLAAPAHQAARAEAAAEQPFQEQIEWEIRSGTARSFLYDMENSVACAVPAEENKRIGAYVQSRYMDEDPSNTRYHMNETALLRFADPGAQVSEPAAIWEEKGFEEVFGVPFVKFKPSRPRPWTCLPIIQKTSLYRPGVRYDDSNQTHEKVLSNLKKAMASIAGYNGMEPFALTGNPNLASVLLLIDVQYSYYGNYGSQNIKGYSANVILTAIDAQTHKKIAAVTLSHELGGIITIQPGDIYEDNIYCASLQTLTSEDKWDGFTEKLTVHERKQAASLFPMSPVTDGNAELFAAMLASEFADAESDPWRKAIYEKGAQEARSEGGILWFRLCAFDPDLKEIGSYNGDPDAWLSRVHGSGAGA